MKANFEYYWYGYDLYRYSFDGVVLPTNGSRALAFACSDRPGAPRATLEQLIARHGRKELLAAPIMRTLLERKWKWFARYVYQVSRRARTAAACARAARTGPARAQGGSTA
jgi:hypothetical protein